MGNRAVFHFLPAMSHCHAASPPYVRVSNAIPKAPTLTDLIQIAFWIVGSLDDIKIQAINKSDEKTCR